MPYSGPRETIETMTTTTDSFALSPDREAAFWQAAQALGVDPQASALTLVRAVLTVRDRAEYAEGFGAAAELRYYLDRGRPIEFLQRPQAGGDRQCPT